MLYYDDDGASTDHEEDATTWIALADMMTGLMAIFLALSIAILIMQQSNQIVITRDVSSVLQEKNIDIDHKEALKGNIVLSESISFDRGQAVLKPEGRAFLDNFIPVYAEAIFELSPEQLERISRLVVEGHTDITGSYSSNMALSNARALAILEYIDKGMGDFPHKQALLARMTAVGRGQNDANPMQNDADRRVIFRFDFKNDFDISGNDDLKNFSQTVEQKMQAKTGN